MSYVNKNEYCNLPSESFRVIRRCSVCKKKSIFINSNKFRVNANGDKIDVWLIYQCKKCKHTYNLTIYERVRKDALSLDLYTGFIENDDELARVYGRDKSLFVRNRAEIERNK